MVEITGSETSLTDETLKKFEEKNSIKLPLEYRNFLLQVNGGYPDPDCFKFHDGSEGSSIDKIFGVCSNKKLSLQAYIDEYHDRMPKHIIPIGRDPGGNYICISTAKQDFGKVYFWDHELEADLDKGESPSYENLTLISENFSDFIDSLYEIDI